MNLDDAAWDGLLRVAQDRGLRDRTAAVRALIAEALEVPPAQGTLLAGDPAQPPPAMTGTVKPPKPTGCDHDWKHKPGASGNLIWICARCDQRSYGRPPGV